MSMQRVSILRVIIRSAWPEIAFKLFTEAVPGGELQVSNSNQSSFTVNYGNDEQIREIRAWGSDAFGCGLVTGCLVETQMIEINTAAQRVTNGLGVPYAI